jgi:hypothetical protein
MTVSGRHLAAATASLLTVGLLTVLPGAGAVTTKPVAKAPKSGKYTGTAGTRRKVTMFVQAKSVSIIAFQFACKSGVGNTSLSDIRVTKTKLGRYRFGIRANGISSYSDNHVDENVSIVVSGRWAIGGDFVSGDLRVKSRHCGDTGTVHWSARRRR